MEQLAEAVAAGKEDNLVLAADRYAALVTVAAVLAAVIHADGAYICGMLFLPSSGSFSA
jgi:hypothetical protein